MVTTVARRTAHQHAVYTIVAPQVFGVPVADLRWRRWRCTTRLRATASSSTDPLVERAATDPRNFVKKGVNWALRSIGSRNVVLHAAALALADRLAGSKDASARWAGKDALRDLSRPLIAARVAKKAAAARARAARRTRR